MSKIIDPINSAGMRGAMTEAKRDRSSMLPPALSGLMIMAAARAICDMEGMGGFDQLGPLTRRYACCQAMEAAEAIADWLEEKYGDQHPGCLAIRSELDEFNKQNRLSGGSG